MTEADFIERHPRLYHMATATALQSIRKHGLLSSEATLNLINIGGQQRAKLLGARRPDSVELNHPEHGRFILRDQKPLRDAALAKCVEGMNPSDFYRLLNERTFLWATEERVEMLLAARAYRKHDQLVITVDTKKLLEAHPNEVELSSINSGATLYGSPPTRGLKTFSKLADYETHNGNRKIVEVTIKGSIPDFAAFIIKAEVRKAGK